MPIARKKCLSFMFMFVAGGAEGGAEGLVLGAVVGGGGGIGRRGIAEIKIGRRDVGMGRRCGGQGDIPQGQKPSSLQRLNRQAALEAVAMRTLVGRHGGS
ncbi:MAG: hypothetical protein IID44_27915 [Planctomycetes bacterium]|nr:hypothetical protein [Planctomycetota bacterium]